jgi:hypothetical protein
MTSPLHSIVRLRKVGVKGGVVHCLPGEFRFSALSFVWNAVYSNYLSQTAAQLDSPSAALLLSSFVLCTLKLQRKTSWKTSA